MNIIKKLVSTYTIDDVEGHTTILATLEDMGNATGRCTMQEGGQIHTAYFSSTQGKPVEEFFLSASVDYLVGCFDPFGANFRRVDSKTVQELLIAEMDRQVAADEMTAEVQAGLLLQFGCFGPITDINGIQALCAPVMVAIFGPSWPERARPLLLGRHPSYLGMIERIGVVRSALSSLKPA